MNDTIYPDGKGDFETQSFRDAKIKSHQELDTKHFVDTPKGKFWFDIVAWQNEYNFNRGIRKSKE